MVAWATALCLDYLVHQRPVHQRASREGKESSPVVLQGPWPLGDVGGDGAVTGAQSERPAPITPLYISVGPARAV